MDPIVIATILKEVVDKLASEEHNPLTKVLEVGKKYQFCWVSGDEVSVTVEAIVDRYVVATTGLVLNMDFVNSFMEEED